MNPWAAVLMLACLAHAGQAGGRLELKPESRLWLEGDSTLHPYSSTATALTADMTLEGGEGASLKAVEEGKPASLTLKVPVAGLKSAHKGLDKNLRAALKADKNPDIVFVLGSYRKGEGAGGKITADGTLSVAGSTKAVTLDLAVSAREGRLVVEGEEPLLMTDFGVKPPQMMLGAVKTADRVVVRFHLELAPRAP